MANKKETAEDPNKVNPEGNANNEGKQDGKELNAVVIAPFRDKDDFRKRYQVGEIVNHFEKNRLDTAISNGLVELQ